MDFYSIKDDYVYEEEPNCVRISSEKCMPRSPPHTQPPERPTNCWVSSTIGEAWKPIALLTSKIAQIAKERKQVKLSSKVSFIHCRFQNTLGNISVWTLRNSLGTVSDTIRFW